MRYAVLINLDYDRYPEDALNFLWQEIEEAMKTAGFQQHGRLFSILCPAREARDLASRAVESIEEHLEFHQKHIHRYMKEFVGFNMDNASNLLLPSPDGIVVEHE